MPWIESHSTLRTHKKLKNLCEKLRINRREGIGLLQCLWWWTITNREDGDLSGLFDHDIAMACDWQKDSKALLKTLHESGFIDRKTNRLHDWLDYAGPYLVKKYASHKKEKLKKIWELHGKTYGRETTKDTKMETSLVTEMVTTNETTKESSTKPNLTKPNQTVSTGFLRDLKKPQEEMLRRLLSEHFKHGLGTEANDLEFKRLVESIDKDGEVKDPMAVAIYRATKGW